MEFSSSNITLETRLRKIFFRSRSLESWEIKEGLGGLEKRLYAILKYLLRPQKWAPIPRPSKLMCFLCSLFRWFDSVLCALYISISTTGHFHFPSWTRTECNPFSPRINDVITVAKNRDPWHKTEITARSTISCTPLKPSCWFGGPGVRVSLGSVIVVSGSACSSGSFIVFDSTSVEVELSMNDVGLVSPKVGVPWLVSCPTNAIRLSLGRHLALVSVSFSLSSQEAPTSLGVGSGTSTRRGVSGWMLSRTCLLRWTYQLRGANSCLSWHDRGCWRVLQSFDLDSHRM